MYDVIKHSKSSDTTKEPHLQLQGSGKVHKAGVVILAKENALKCRINELEAEVENLRTTIKFYQDIYLREE